MLDKINLSFINSMKERFFYFIGFVTVIIIHVRGWFPCVCNPCFSCFAGIIFDAKILKYYEKTKIYEIL